MTDTAYDLPDELVEELHNAEKLIVYVHSHEAPLTTRELVESTRLPRPTVRRYTANLAERGMLSRTRVLTPRTRGKHTHRHTIAEEPIPTP